MQYGQFIVHKNNNSKDRTNDKFIAPKRNIIYLEEENKINRVILYFQNYGVFIFAILGLTLAAYSYYHLYKDSNLTAKQGNSEVNIIKTNLDTDYYISVYRDSTYLSKNKVIFFNKTTIK